MFSMKVVEIVSPLRFSKSSRHGPCPLFLVYRYNGESHYIDG